MDVTTTMRIHVDEDAYQASYGVPGDRQRVVDDARYYTHELAVEGVRLRLTAVGDWGEVTSSDYTGTLRVGDHFNGYQIRATVLMDNGVNAMMTHMVILGVRTTHLNESEYVVAAMNIGGSEWWQGHYFTDSEAAVRRFLLMTELSALSGNYTT